MAAGQMCGSAAGAVLLLRHAESEFNRLLSGAQQGSEGVEAAALLPCMRGLADSPLSDAGVAQCGEAQSRVPDRPGIVVVSPLRRALETARLTFPGLASGEVPNVVTPLAAEHLQDICDVGTPLSVLRGLYPWARFPEGADVWWPSGLPPAQAWDALQQGEVLESEEAFVCRARQLREFVAPLREERGTVVVVAHAGVIFELTSHEKCGEKFGCWVGNCDVAEMRD